MILEYLQPCPNECASRITDPPQYKNLPKKGFMFVGNRWETLFLKPQF